MSDEEARETSRESSEESDMKVANPPEVREKRE
jgi:hypothetical protein